MNLQSPSGVQLAAENEFQRASFSCNSAPSIDPARPKNFKGLPSVSASRPRADSQRGRFTYRVTWRQLHDLYETNSL